MSPFLGKTVAAIDLMASAVTLLLLKLIVAIRIEAHNHERPPQPNRAEEHHA